MSRSTTHALAALALICTGGTALAQPYGLTDLPLVGPYLDSVLPPVPPAEPTNWSAVNAFPLLTFQNPMGLQAVPGTNQLFVWEREGRVYLIENAPGTSTKKLILNLGDRCQGWDDSGLFAVVPHPQFQTNRQIFVYYTYVTPGMVTGSATARPPGQPLLPASSDPRNRLSRFTLDENGVTIPGSEFVLINQTITKTYHKGGGMFFHPVNGLLYLTVGDDEAVVNDQVINRDLASGILRIDVDKRGGSFSHAPPRQPTNGVTFTNGVPNYFIPNDNPFVGQAGVLEEFYSLGLRSPHRMTFDPVSHRIHIADVGHGTAEEINVIEPGDPAGLNFQWPIKEGNAGELTGSFTGVSRSPVISFPHIAGQALPQMKCIIGGYVYRGAVLQAQIGGKYICADNKNATVYAIDDSTNPPTATYLVTLPRSTGPNSGDKYDSISSFGVDADNELYMTVLGFTDGRIYKLQATGGGNGGSMPLPPTLSGTGIFSNLATLTPNTKLIPYSINAPFWSDGAVKSRWAAIPDTEKVGFTPTGEWTFPTGSVFVKHFELPSDDTNASIRRRLETRLIVKMASGGVYGATYRWREDNSDADLLTSAGLIENIPISTGASLGPLTSQDIGNPALSGSMTRTGDDLVITAGGTDISGTTDQFRFSHQQRTGDFDVRMRVNSLSQAHKLSKVGLMARATLAANSRFAHAVTYPPDGGRAYNMEFRTTNGGSAGSIPFVGPGTAFPRWMRLRREGDDFISFTSLDGINWTEIGRRTVDLPDTAYVGVAVTAHTASPTTTASVHLESDTRPQSWYYPSRNDCVLCHNPQAGDVLGLKTRQLNCNQLFPGTGVMDNQIRAWNHVGLFNNAPPEAAIESMDKLAAVTDTTASLEKRARSYLDSNCSHCHRPGVAQASWDARYDVPLLQQGIINGRIGNDVGITGSRVVAPQDLVHSMLHSRINRVGQDQMPPLGRNRIDTDAVEMLAAWINSLPSISVSGATDGTAVLSSDNLNLTGTAAAASGTIVRVEFWDNGVKIGESTEAPYSLTLPGPLAFGEHQITAVVYDSQGRASSSGPIALNVLPLKLSLSFNDLGEPLLQTQIPSGRNYVIEYSDDLSLPWSHLENGTANGQMLDVRDPSAPATHRFYRLRVLP
ncbi:MAG: hypothetical protein EOP88_01330 [Verrucomicrobiaceae bacterium]|nr:MAG: hypothetical protein EOP88_01330 [Verrucomicrobiaceae bacterium]